jgi:hypothetical protein
MATLDASKGVIIIVDSADALDVNTGKSNAFLQELETAVLSAECPGVNGVESMPITNPDTFCVYFDNTDATLLCKSPSVSRHSRRPAIKILESEFSADEFVLDIAEGFVYMDDGKSNSVNGVLLAGGKIAIILGGTNEPSSKAPFMSLLAGV